MNLTLQGQQGAPARGLLRYPTPQAAHLNPKVAVPSSAAIDHLCGGFLFGPCVDSTGLTPSEDNSYYERSHYQLSRLEQSTPQNARSLEPRKKISVSLGHSVLPTPKKQESSSQTPKALNSLNGGSRNKRVKTVGGHEVERVPSPHKGLRLSTLDNRTGVLMNINQLRESLKPKTNVGSPPPQFKGHISTIKKTKLSISSNFRSQIQAEPRSVQVFEMRLQHGNFLQDDSSFMTAKYDPHHQRATVNSNIGTYNALMNDHKTWKAKKTPQNNYPQLSHSKEPIKILDNDILPTRLSQSKVASHHQIPPTDSAQNISQSSEFRAPSHPDSPLQMTPTRPPKRIGEYAATVITFNNSEQCARSEQESVVISRGPLPHNHFSPSRPSQAFKRGSVKDPYKEPVSQQFKRACTSFGAEEGPSSDKDSAQSPQKVNQYISYPIEEDESSEAEAN